MYQRAITPILQRFASIYQVVSITGPRQSGKTTVARMLFPNLPYVSLENIDVRASALQDPRAFLARYAEGAIFDEIQNAPELLSYMMQIVDENQKPGQFIITGSQNFAISNTISQSLAGRVGIITLLPLSTTELNEPTITWHEAAIRGGYPKLNQLKLEPHEFYPSYIQTYVERDIRELKNIGNLTTFKNFIQLCAGHIGQTINYTSLAAAAGIGVTTAREWLSLLEASYIIFRLPTYYKNLNNRRIKMPKLYFYDTGLAVHLLGIESIQQLDNYYRKGAIFENLIILELTKQKLNQGRVPQLSFWRDYNGTEIDLIFEDRGEIKAIEMKTGSTCHTDYIKNLETFKTLEPSAKSYIIYTGVPGGFATTTLVSWRDLTTL
jgi:hypothetical protein